MLRFVVRRLIAMVLVLFAISVMTFLIFQAIPNGDPATRLAGRSATPETIESIRTAWGFDQPLYVQYGRTMEKIFTGEVISYSQQVSVFSQIEQGLPATLSLALGTAVIWLVLGITLGVLGAMNAGGLIDRLITVLAMVGVSAPVFVLGALLLYVFAVKLPLFPDGGYVPLTENPLSWLHHMVLPWCAQSMLFIGFYSRVLRSTMLETMGEDFVRTAHAKGITERRVLVRHILRNSMLPIVALWGLDFAAVMAGGTILAESIFDLHGVGQYAADSITQLDVPPVLVITLLGAFLVVLLSAITDVIVALLDPRVRLEM